MSASAPKPVAFDLIIGDTLPPKLSDFGFFVGKKPNARVVGYTLNTALFSDYTDKERFVFVPTGRKAVFDRDGVVQFPVGSAIVKSFTYPGRAFPIETRVLLHRPGGWIALPYVWNGDGSEAVLKRAGTRVNVTYQDKPFSYAVPNVNQCKECHASGTALIPIGPKARNLGSAQMEHWRKSGILSGFATGTTLMPRFEDATAPIDARARAYLDVNCGHCHSAKGAASNSGLYLTWEEKRRVPLGIGKPPVAAGRGSGGREVSIEPGHPERSILTFRMKSTEPGIAMPEVGRALVHAEGVKLIEDWIAAMPKNEGSR